MAEESHNCLKMCIRDRVVSNNNSAIVNVLEKLSKYDMDFIVALLGSTANKEKFIETQEMCIRDSISAAGEKNTQSISFSFFKKFR